MTRKEVEQWYFAKAEITVDKEYNDAKLSHADVIEWLVELSQLLQQCNCSTMRAFLAQKQMDVNVAAANAPQGSMKRYAEEMKLKLLQEIQKFIRDSHPVS